jgi:hypothetical protein
MSSSSSSTRPPQGCQKRSDRERYARFILVLGDLAGDFWHCAAASILSNYWRRPNIGTPPFNDCEFVICIVVVLKPQQDDEGTTTNQTPGKRQTYATWRNGAKDMFEYFRAIGVLCMVITVEKATGRGTDLNINKLSDAGIRQCWDDQKEHAADSFSDVLQQRQTFVPHESLVENSQCIIRYDAGTSVLMELVGYLGVEISQGILAAEMVFGPDTQVINRIRALNTTIYNARRRAQNDTIRILILNYRQTDYHPQHNANREILQQIKELAAAKGIAVVTLPAIKYLKRTQDIFNHEDDVFYLYGQPGSKEVKLKYGEKARFWAHVAQNAARWNLVGVIGGRSGSMDLPAFVGVRCLSWDEPLFQVKEAREVGDGEYEIPQYVPADDRGWDDAKGGIGDHPTKKRKTSEHPLVANSLWTSKWTRDQGRQILRLLNQVDLMHVSFLKRSTLRKDGDNRLYSALEEKDDRLECFLSDTSNAPRVGLGFEARPGWTVGLRSFECEYFDQYGHIADYSCFCSSDLGYRAPSPKA